MIGYKYFVIAKTLTNIFQITSKLKGKLSRWHFFFDDETERNSVWFMTQKSKTNIFPCVQRPDVHIHMLLTI